MERSNMLCSGLLFVGLSLVLHAATAVPTETPTSDYDAVFSNELSTDIIPCRSWIFPCENGVYQCTTQDQFYSFTFGFQLGCPNVFNSTATPPPATTCTLEEYDETCSFVAGAPTCVSWLRGCSLQYSCTTEEEYSTVTEEEGDMVCSFPALAPPSPDSICIPVNDTCQWHNPCRVWQNWCGGDYICGSEAQYAAFIHGPQPICLPPPENATEPVPEGECVYQSGQCEWSECVSWLSPCRTSWICGSQYERRVSQSYPPPPCPYPGPYFVPPPEPGVCQLVSESGQCEFQGEPECTGGREYQECGTPCPRTCENYQLDFACEQSCVPGCFCPGSLVLHEGECIPSHQCPGESPCNVIDCAGGYECLIYEPTGEGYCSPNCEELNPCAPNQQCVTTDVICIRSPCPPVLSCEGPCNVIDCAGGYECLIYEPTGEGYCSPNCEELNPCAPNQQCVTTDVTCIRSPCPPVLSCENTCSTVACADGYECLIYEETGEAYCSPNCEELNPCGPDQQCVINPLYCIRAPCPGVLTCRDTCTGGKEWQNCGTACPLSCSNYSTEVACTLQCVQGCFCPYGTVLHEDECVPISDCPNYISPCATILCAEGYTCEVQGLTGYCEPSCEPSSNLCEEGERCELVTQDCQGREPCPHTYRCVEDTCTGGKVWQNCGTACPLSCANYNNPYFCTLQCVPGCACPPGTVLNEDGECVPFAECPGYISPCAYTDCRPGYTCRVYELTNQVYCDPSCTPPHDSFLCEEGKTCNLLEGDCHGREPCPHSYECLPHGPCKAWRLPCFNQTWVCSSYETFLQQSQSFLRPACPVYETAPLQPKPGQCVLVEDTCQFVENCTGGKEWQDCGSACPRTCDNYEQDIACTLQCVQGCFCPEGKVELDGTCVEPSMCSGCERCADEDVCSVTTEDRYQFVVCKGPTAEPCYEGDSLPCPRHSRCLTHSVTGDNFCLESCYIDNGGCSDDEICYYERADENCNPRLEPCFKTACADIPDSVGTCPIGWEHSSCASACPTTCEDYLDPMLKACPAVCASCQCPPGMVVFRGRCVDPLECYTLMKGPTPLNPLPQPDNVLLMRFTLSGISPESFDSSEFASFVYRDLTRLGFNQPVTVYAVFAEDGNTVVVLKLTGDPETLSLIADSVMENRDKLTVKVSAVAVVDTPSKPDDDDDDDESVPIPVVVGSIVAVIAICSLLAFVIVLVAVVRAVKRNARRAEIPADGKEKAIDNLSFVSLVSKEAENDYQF